MLHQAMEKSRWKEADSGPAEAAGVVMVGQKSGSCKGNKANRLEVFPSGPFLLTNSWTAIPIFALRRRT